MKIRRRILKKGLPTGPRLNYIREFTYGTYKSLDSFRRDLQYIFDKRFIPTNDEFAPSFPDNFVRSNVRFSSRWNDDSKWDVRISFWGLDDFGIILDKEFTNEEEARDYYLMKCKWLRNLTIVDKNILYQLGFEIF